MGSETMAVTMRPGHDQALLGIADARSPHDEVTLEAGHHLELLALRRELAADPAPVGGTLARAAVKRTVDIVVSATLLLLAVPVIALVALAIKLDSRGPVLYTARRIGHRGRLLRMYKFRKMHHLASGPALTTAADVRFTRVGRWLAKSKLDELPQLWNVVRGDMSLIGPRPEVPRYTDLENPLWRRVLAVRPGITDPLTLRLRDEESMMPAGEAERE